MTIIAREPIDDGGPAFPPPHECGYFSQDGMSLRDYFAAKALAAKMAPGLIGYEDYAPEHRAKLISRLVRDCWEVADAMLKARSA